MMNAKRTRRDLHIGALHVIVRGYREPPQYGALAWREDGSCWVVDVWIRQTLYTFRRSSW